MKRTAILVGAAALSLGVAAAAAQSASPAPASAARPDVRAVVADVRRIVSANYVLPEVRAKLDAALARGLSQGRYDVSDPAELADRINADLSAVAHDKHLHMQYAPQQQARLAARPRGAGADDAPPSAQEILRATQLNHGIAELKVLPGNIRYMRYDGFVWAGPKTAEALDTAMRFLRDGDAVVVDLRTNGGGSPEAVQYLVSHFLEPNRPIVTFYMRGDPAERLSTLASLPAGRMTGKPLYVLTSGHTASAAEEFTGHVAGFKLGELIGENTAGAGFRNEFFPVAGGYVISVSVGRAVLASTGKDWEGVGFAPTTKVDSDKALDMAQVHALRRIASAASGEDKRMFEARAAILDAQLNPAKTALPLEKYAGTYGERSVTLDSGGLAYQRQGGPKIMMIPVAANEFSFAEDPLSRVRFSVAGNSVTGLELMRSDGTHVEAQRRP
jgi:Peptidase family S41/N-terminal domain of Peptidase_S41 in eukaryotic IRBP